MRYYDLMVTQGWGLALAIAALVTLAVSVSALCVGAVLGALVAWSKLSGGRTLRIVADTYTTILRGIPDLLVIYLFYFGGSSALGAVGRLFGYDGFIGLPAFATGALAVGLISGAYQAEVYRGAYLFIAKGELEAARAVGMNRLLLFRRIILPQALRFAIPGLGNCWQMALKESALISVTGLVELLRQAQVGSGSTRQPFDFYITAAALYLLLTTISSYGFERAETRANRGVKRA
jgi:octopine/nopaline transport system permease protein